MRPRTPTLIWIPFVFSVGTVSWAFLLAGLILLSAVILAPALQEVRAAEVVRNDYQATLDLLDQKIAMQKEFIDITSKDGGDPVLMERLASRQLNLNRKDQDILILDPAVLYRDRSIESLLAESLTPVSPKPATSPTIPYVPAVVTSLVVNPAIRPFLIIMACAAIALSFFLGVKYERSPGVLT
jgi:hypothetical protein